MNLNTSPYYDDFVAEKKFSRVLFKPGYAVQARELTQLQTILQSQIQRFGDNIFSQGTVITGCAESHNFNVPFVKVSDITGTLEQYIGQTVASLAGVSAIIKQVADGSQAQTPNLNTLYVQYTSNDLSTGLRSQFNDGESLSIKNADGSLGPVLFTVAGNGTGFGSLFSLGDGIVYADGFFVLHSNQTIILDRYSQNPTQNVGYILSETIATSDDDVTLLDPASGSYNYTAPGADRLAVSTILTSYDPATEVAPVGFVLLFEVENGIITRRFNKTQYAELGIELAQRTYDEAGDYTVQNFPLFVSEHLDNGSNHGIFSANAGGDPSKLVVGVQPGKAYVRGFEQELYATENLTTDKAIDTRTVNSEFISTDYGNYVLVNELAGPWSLNTRELVQLHSVAVHAASSGNYSGAAPPSSQIGTAIIRDIVYIPNSGARPGSSAANYKIYLSDVVLTSGSFSSGKPTYLDTNQVQSLYLPDTVRSFADVVQDINAFSLGLQETKYTALLFPLTRENTKYLANQNYVAIKQYTASTNTSGTFSITTSGTDTWAFSNLATQDEVDNNIIVVADTAFSGGTLGTKQKGRYLDITPSMVSVTPTVLSFSIGTTTGTPSVVVMAKVRSVDPVGTKTLIPDVYVQFNTAADGTVNLTESGTAINPYLLGVHDTFKISNVWVNVVANNPTGNGLATLAAMQADAATNGGAGTNWVDATSSFFLVSGTTDTQYGIDGLASNTHFTSRSILVRLSWLSHSSSAEYYTVQSYPLPPNEHTAPTATQINWWEIPKYTASNGTTYSLRDTIDFRATITSSAGTAVTPNTATINPVVVPTYQGSITTPTPDGTFIADIQYYMNRVDRVVLDSAGTFSVVKGAASDTPAAPKAPNNSMTLGYVHIPAFPSLSPYYARVTNRPEFATSIVLTDNRRFTMKDLGVMQNRLDRLEYQASLSALEQSAADMQILNSAGDDRHKNGILVDSFIGHNVGNVYDPAYACSISEGILRPCFLLDNIGFDIDSTSVNVMQNANDVIIVVRQLLTDIPFVLGSIITGVGGGTGTIMHVVPIASNTLYRWVRVYLSNGLNLVGSFLSGNTVNVTTGPSTTGNITYTGWTLPSTVLQPTLIVYPSVGSLGTLPYIHSVYAQNDTITQTRNCASDVLFTFEGTVSLSPSLDTWMDTSVHSEVQLNNNNFFDNWKNLVNAWGTQWNDWKTLWAGKSKDVDISIDTTSLGTALTTEQRQRLDGISLSSEADITGNVIPFIRAQVINFTATRLKTNTQIFVYFDGVNVTSFCKNTGDSGYGGLAKPLIADANGNVSGQFRVPAETFTVGSKSFVLTDNSTDPTSTNMTTVAVSVFTASGAQNFEERTILSTRKPRATISSQRQTQNLVVSRQVSTSDVEDASDPLSQTFFVSNSDNGVLLTKIDVYFQARSAVNSITVQVREVVNGYPTDIILPFGSVTVQPADVNVSADGSAPTEFHFTSPVYLKNNTEYCFSIIPTGNDTNYQVWESVVGDVVVGGTQVADKKSNVGSLFAVNNNTAWVELINESLTFTIYTAEFNPNTTGTVVLTNKTVDYAILTPHNPLTIFNVGDVVQGTALGSTGVGVIQYVTANNTTDSMTGYAQSRAQILITSGSFLPSDSFANGTLTLTNRIVNAMAPALSQLAFNTAKIDWQYEIYQSNGTAFSGYSTLDVAGTTELTSEMAVFSHSITPKTFQIKGTLSTTESNIAPIIDFGKLSCVVVANHIDNAPASGVGANLESLPTGGTALNKYISRTVVLDNGEDAEDLRVYFSAFFPSSSGVQVWAKTSNICDPAPFASRPWQLMTQNIIPTSSQFNDYFFTLTAAQSPTVSTSYSSSGVLYVGFRTFAIKIVTTSASTAQIPIIKDLRAIALLI
jgi:hypothetical protein